MLRRPPLRNARVPGSPFVRFAATALAVVAAACSRPPPLMADPAALAQAQRALSALPEFAGRAPQVHSAALFHDDDIEIALVDPADAAALHVYRYRQGRWRREDTMQHGCEAWRRSPGHKSDDLPLARVDFAAVAKVRANWYERARTVPGALADPEFDRLAGVWFYTRDYRESRERGGARGDAGRGQWSTGPITGQDGAGYRIEFDIDGSVSRFERLP